MVKKGRMLKKEREERIKDEDLFKTVEEVFDAITMGYIYKLHSRGVIWDLKGVVSAGKEARVYWAKARSGEDRAVKIYLVATSDFRKSIKKYIEGDPRFESIPESNFRHLIYLWTKKEFKNLKRMRESGVRVPEPIDFLGNVLVMQFIGEEGKRAPLLKEVAEDMSEEEMKEAFSDLAEQLRLMVCEAELVHGDLSEYNIMMWEKPWIIDVSQAVDLSHPKAYEFLHRDLENIFSFFSRFISLEGAETLRGELVKCLEA